MTSSSPGLTSIKYPKQLETSSADYVIFTHSEYRSNRTVRGGRVGTGLRDAAAPAANGSRSILLYMPTSTPPTNQSNDWGAVTFDGPLGVLLNDLNHGLITEMDKVNDLSDIKTKENAIARGKSIGNQLTNQFEGAKDKILPSGKQWAINRLASNQPGNANQMMALNKGEIFNPNVEMLYKGTTVRQFSMAFTLVPKSRLEAQVVNDIIKEFKVWSAPSNANNDGMYKVPHIWQVRYESGGSANRNMNIFKKAALTNVAVQSNNGLDMHVAFDDGMPVTTSLSLNFTEVDVITREDQQNAPNNVGF